MSRMGQEISKLRKEIGLTQKQLATKVGVAESYILDIESGKKIISDDIARKISKALRTQINQVEIYEEEIIDTKPAPENVARIVQKPVQHVWNEALAGVLMNVPILDISLTKSNGSRPLPIISNKVEGHPKDKVFYIVIPDNEMSGFRIYKGDFTLGYKTSDFDKEGYYVIEYLGKRLIRQLKKIDNDKYLLMMNDGRLSTETVSMKQLKILGKLIRLELKLD